MTRITCDPVQASSIEEFANSELYKNWLANFSEGWDIKHIHVHFSLRLGTAIGMAFVTVVAVDPSGKPHTVCIYLRGATVEILPVLIAPDGSQFVAFVEQYRVPAGREVISTPAGMVKPSDEPAKGADVKLNALREVAEELDIELAWTNVWPLNYDVTGHTRPWFVSPGGTDEVVTFYAATARLDKGEILALHGRIGGAAFENEHTQVHVVPLSKAMQYASRSWRPDMKTMLGLLLYERHLSRH